MAYKQKASQIKHWKLTLLRQSSRCSFAALARFVNQIQIKDKKVFFRQRFHFAFRNHKYKRSCKPIETSIIAGDRNHFNNLKISKR
ncbi:hypothetical protein NC99_37820 [Sunxiuqinia dokdonensis]|uniref:Uncharacterized protein n=1 Tax=Sunxiuqinia dokdonensis TaxID=1409788 RepID=A0A0L8V4D9_9BACT|nr:hypothetical protein NC99_37820 [Sunxiuqinia dokdonensis]